MMLFIAVSLAWPNAVEDHVIGLVIENDKDMIAYRRVETTCGALVRKLQKTMKPEDDPTELIKWERKWRAAQVSIFLRQQELREAMRKRK
jgi:hypothetical protein